MEPRFVYIHGNGTEHWSYGWSSWLKKELENLGYSTFFETMPDSIIARSRYWLTFIKEHVKAGEHDVLIGWSSGAAAAMRYAEENKLLGSILVSPCYTDLGDEMEKQSGYFDKPWRWQNIQANQKKIGLIWGDDDPFIPQDQFEYISKQLNPTQITVHQGGHFIERSTFPELLQYIRENY